MTDAELRKLKRTDLLEMLVEQGKENEALKAKVAELEAKLSDREIRIEEAGTLAQAAFEMNGVLEAAQAAANQYLDNIKMLNERQESICARKETETKDKCAAMEQATKERCELMKEETKNQCEQLKQQTEEECAKREQEAEERCIALDKKAEADVEARWEDLSARLEQFYNAHEGLRDLITASGAIQRD